MTQNANGRLLIDERIHSSSLKALWAPSTVKCNIYTFRRNANKILKILQPQTTQENVKLLWPGRGSVL